MTYYVALVENESIGERKNGRRDKGGGEKETDGRKDE